MTLPDSQGLQRRTLIKTSLAAIAVAGLPVLNSARAAAASSAGPNATADSPLAPTSDWRRYLVGPKSRTVTPVGISGTAGDVSQPAALLKPGGAVTVLSRPKPPTPPAWPAGTVATASSFHAPNNGNNGTLTTTTRPTRSTATGPRSGTTPIRTPIPRS